MKLENRMRVWTGPVVSAGLAVLMFGLFLWALAGLENGQAAEEKKRLERTLRLGAVSCYATDGQYPPTLASLEERCGIRIDRDRFAVFYEVFAENLMPEITVVEVQEP